MKSHSACEKYRAMARVKAIILSCKTIEQLEVARNCVTALLNLHWFHDPDVTDTIFISYFLALLGDREHQLSWGHNATPGGSRVQLVNLFSTDHPPT